MHPAVEKALAMIDASPDRQVAAADVLTRCNADGESIARSSFFSAIDRAVSKGTLAKSRGDGKDPNTYRACYLSRPAAPAAPSAPAGVRVTVPAVDHVAAVGEAALRSELLALREEVRGGFAGLIAALGNSGLLQRAQADTAPLPAAPYPSAAADAPGVPDPAGDTLKIAPSADPSQAILQTADRAEIRALRNPAVAWLRALREAGGRDVPRGAMYEALGWNQESPEYTNASRDAVRPLVELGLMVADGPTVKRRTFSITPRGETALHVLRLAKHPAML